MPDHIHGILFLENSCFLNSCGDVAMQHHHKEKEKPATFSPEYFSSISPKKKSLSAIIRSFKSIVSRTIHENYPEMNFTWQTLYHDHTCPPAGRLSATKMN